MEVNKLKRGIVLSLLIITFFMIFNGCEKKNVVDYTNLNTTDLLMEAYWNKDNDSTFAKICKLLNDSIKEDNQYAIETYLFINIGEGDTIVSFGFYDESNHYADINERLMFDIYIENENTLYANKKRVELSEIGNLAYQYTFMPELEYYRMLKRTEKSEDFGEVETFGGGVNLVLNANNNKKISIKEWKILFDCLEKMINVFDTERNNFALKKLGKRYDELSYKEKISIGEVFPYKIMILSDHYNIWGSNLSD